MKRVASAVDEGIAASFSGDDVMLRALRLLFTSFS